MGKIEISVLYRSAPPSNRMGGIFNKHIISNIIHSNQKDFSIFSHISQLYSKNFYIRYTQREDSNLLKNIIFFSKISVNTKNLCYTKLIDILIKLTAKSYIFIHTQKYYSGNKSAASNISPAISIWCETMNVYNQMHTLYQLLC